MYDVLLDANKIKQLNKRQVAATSYYTVFEAKLLRPVPFVLLKARRTKKRRFNYALYPQLEKVNIQLGRYFDAYCLNGQQEVVLKWVNPKMIERLKQMWGYDIEFIDDSLFCYSALLNQDALFKLTSKSLNLHASLNQ